MFTSMGCLKGKFTIIWLLYSLSLSFVFVVQWKFEIFFLEEIFSLELLSGGWRSWRRSRTPKSSGIFLFLLPPCFFTSYFFLLYAISSLFPPDTLSFLSLLSPPLLISFFLPDGLPPLGWAWKAILGLRYFIPFNFLVDCKLISFQANH